MRPLVRIAILFYMFVILFVGFTGLLVLAHIISLKPYLDFLIFVYRDPHVNTLLGFVIAATMLISLAFAHIIYGRQEKERIIAFDNPLGRVTMSLSALEDLIRRLVIRIPQIKEIRPDIISTKRGIEVEIRLVLRSDVNIPEMTAQLQDMIKVKINDVIGKEERINVRIHVIKIATDSLKSKRGGDRDFDDDDVAPPSPVHFHGYRA